jgi:putative nucleotidyltransferase with HDIG domain
MQLSPKDSEMDVESFWEHSLARGLISRNLARKLGYPDPERAYLAGLLHDLGILVNVLLIPKEFFKAFKIAAESGRSLREVELEQIGISHEVTGVLLADHWQLFDYLAEVIRRHHDVENATIDPDLAALVNISDLLCRTSGLGYGYVEDLTFTLQEEPAWKIISSHSLRMQDFDMVRFTLEVESYVKEVRTLVSVLFRL